MNNVTFENYPDIRDLTRKLGRDIQSQLGGHIETVKTHFRPGSVFGPYVSSGSKSENPRTAAAAFAQFTAVFKQIAVSTALNVEPGLPEAIDINFATPVLCPFIYPHRIGSPAGARRLTVTAPFRFVVAFPEYSFSDLRNLISSSGPKDKLREFVLHYTVLNFLVMQNKRLLSLFEALRFPFRSECFDEFGALPITTIAAPAGSIRPPDAFLAQVAKFSGSDTAEELVDLDAWNSLRDPLADWFREEAAKFPAVNEAAG